MEVIALKCPNCGAAISTEQKECKYCRQPVIIQNYHDMVGMSPLQINKYAAAYRKVLQDNPDNKEINASIGACYLKLKLYDKALEAFEKAIQDNFEDAEPYYLAAIALLQGKKAFVAPRAAIDKAIEYLNAANMINPQAIYYYFLAYIKLDYFERKCLNTQPDYQELLQTAADLGMTEEKAEAFFEILGVARPESL